MKCVTEQRLKKYYDLTRRALRKVTIVSSLQIDAQKVGDDFFDMAQRYVSDARYFWKKGDYVTAFAALNYAHGWLDAGARLGVFDVQGDNELFVVDEEWQKK